MHPEKSTIGRSQIIAAPKQPSTPPGASLLRAGLQVLTAISPSLATRVIARVWFTPPRAPLRDAAREQLARGRKLDVRMGGQRIAAWSFGSGPRVLLVHGWGGHAGQLVDFVAPLVARGFEVVTFDGPGHGQSSGSALGYRQGSFVEVARAMRAVVDAVGPVTAIVAHSGGAIATGIAFDQGLTTDRLVLVAPMTRPLRYAERWSAWLGLDETLARGWEVRASDRAGFSWADIDLVSAPRRFTPPPVLVVHDRDDREVPFDDGRALAAAWPQAIAVETTGLGHRRILHDTKVIDRVVGFVTHDG